MQKPLSGQRILTELFLAGRFALVGLFATAIHVLIVWRLLSDSVLPPLMANALAFCGAFGFSFAGNYLWTFGAPGSPRSAMLRFLTISLSAFCLNSLLLTYILHLGILDPKWSAIGSAIVIPAITFLASRLWVFKHHTSQERKVAMMDQRVGERGGLRGGGLGPLPWILTFLMLFLLLTLSLKIVVESFSLDADSSHSLMLWLGIHRYGIEGITEWIFTQDNWLLSLVSFHFLGYALLGPEGYVPIVSGWLIFVFSGLISGWIAWRLGARKSPVLIVVLLLSLGHYAHLEGFVSYSTSHNITNLFGLMTIALIIEWIHQKNPVYGVIAGILLIAGAVSDPWMVAAYNLPLLIVAIASASTSSFSFFFSRTESITLGFISLLTLIAAKTRLFGILDFLPSMHYQIGNWETIKGNLGFLVKDLGSLFNVVPWGSPQDMGAAAGSVAWVSILSFFIVHRALHEKKVSNQKIRFFLLFSCVSMGGSWRH